MAHQGTLFIDEAGDIPAPMQIKLLRVFQDHRFMRVGGEEERHSDFRLICATNKDLWAEVKSGHFREDMYYRLSVVPLTIPPLRSRKEGHPAACPVLSGSLFEAVSPGYPAAQREGAGSALAV